MSNPNMITDNKLTSFYHAARVNIEATESEMVYAADDDILAQIEESSELKQTVSEQGDIRQYTCGKWEWKNSPKTGLPYQFQMFCTCCLACRTKTAREIVAGLQHNEQMHQGYSFKICDNKEALRIMNLFGKDFVLRMPLPHNRNFLFMSQRLMSIHNEPITKSMAFKAIDELGDENSTVAVMAIILGDKPTSNRRSGVLHRSTGAEAFDAFSSTDTDEFVADEANMEHLEYSLDEPDEGVEIIAYYGFSLIPKSAISASQIKRIGDAAQLDALEKTIDDIPENLQDVQRVLNIKKDLFLKAVNFIASLTGLEIEIRVTHYETFMTKDEIDWSEEANRKSAQKLRRYMSYFSDPDQFVAAGQPSGAKTPVPI